MKPPVPDKPPSPAVDAAQQQQTSDPPALSLTQKYALQHKLDDDDIIPDGFYDLGRDSATTIWGLAELTKLINGPVRLDDREVILVDRRVDVPLRQFIIDIRDAVSECSDQLECIRIISRRGTLISDQLMSSI